MDEEKKDQQVPVEGEAPEATPSPAPEGEAPEVTPAEGDQPAQ